MSLKSKNFSVRSWFADDRQFGIFNKANMMKFIYTVRTIQQTSLFRVKIQYHRLILLNASVESVMQRYTHTLTKYYGRVKPVKPLAQGLRQILDDVSDNPLEKSAEVQLINYYLGKDMNPIPAERKLVIEFFERHQSYNAVVRFGRKHLFVNSEMTNISTSDTTASITNASTSIKNDIILVNNIQNEIPVGLLRDDVTTNELKLFIYSLIKMGNIRQLDIFLKSIISQISIQHKSRVIVLIGETYMRLSKMARLEDSAISEADALDRWTKWVTIMDGSCEFTSYMNNTRLLRPILQYIQELEKSDSPFRKLENGLNLVKRRQGVTACSQLSTTLIYLANYNKSFKLAEDLWDYKINNKLHVERSDLTEIMRSYNYYGKFNELSKVYSENPQAHHDASQFDYLLLAHAKTSNWGGLKEQFDALFGIGKLPNIRHYEIIMYSLALLGNVESIEQLYSQYLRRGMIPTYPILQSLLQCYYKSGKPAACFEQFQLFEKYSIQPTPASYTIMFKVYQRLNDISAALRLLKTMTEEKKIPVIEEHFIVLMQMCSRVTNHLIAREIFNIMKDHYDIKPTASSVSALMNVYIESKLYKQAIDIFDEYSKLTYIKNDPHLIDLYTSAILAEMKSNNEANCDNLFETVSKLDIPKNSKFYKILLLYMVNLKNYSGAEDALMKLLKNPSYIFKANAGHFEVIMETYSRISYSDGIFELYKIMTDFHIPVNSKILYYLVKATFKVQMSQKEDLTRSIEFVNKIMEEAAANSIDSYGNIFHPSIVGWALRTVAKYYSPKKALEMLNKYDKLFYDTNIRSVDNKFSLMRSLVVLFGELGEWDQFDIIFNNILKQLERYEKLPSSTIPNIKLRSLFVGIFSYKVRHLVETHQVQDLPRFLETLTEKKFILDNNTWNETVIALFSDSATINHGLEIVNSKLIHGYNLIHKNRLLSRLKSESLTQRNNSWFLDKKLEDPKSLVPKLYLKSKSFNIISKRLDSYLNNCDDIEEILRELIEKYGYFMKSYLMRGRNDVRDWYIIEENHKTYLELLRTTKRVVPIDKF